MDFPDLLNHLRTLVDNASADGSRSSWTAVDDAINRARAANNIDLKSLTTMCSLLSDALRTGSCEDRQIALRMTLVCALHMGQVSYWEFDKSSFRELPKKERRTIERNVVRSVLCSASCTSLGLRNSVSDPQGYWDVNLEVKATMALKACNWTFLDILFQYGFWNGSTQWDDFQNYKEIRNYVRSHYRNRNLANELNYPVRDPWDDWERLEASSGKTSMEKGRGFHRTRHILWALRAVTVVPSQRRDAYLRCLRLYFAALPDPLVSAEEVHDFLNQFRAGNQPLVHRLVGRYIRLFGRQPFGPRSLKHLSCCVVRAGLVAAARNSNVVLPKLVKDLDIPESLKGFLLGAPE